MWQKSPIFRPRDHHRPRESSSTKSEYREMSIVSGEDGSGEKMNWIWLFSSAIEISYMFEKCRW